MPEGMNVEIARKLTESKPEAGHKPSRADEWVEIAEAVMLALVAVATAWSGYQSAEWNGHQALLYGTSARLRVEAAATREEARQLQVYDALTLNAWIEAKQRNDPNGVAIYQRRFSPEFRAPFEAWLKMDPLNNPKAPIGPAFMPEYHNARLVRAQQLGDEATAAFTEGTEAREMAERYVRITVLLATILFLTAVAQRFKIRKVRLGLFLIAAALMVYALATVGAYPRL